MHKFSTNTQAALKLSTALLAAAALSACTSPRVGPTAGASSSWAPQAYEQNGSIAAVTSRLSGSEINGRLNSSGNLTNGGNGLSVAQVTGTITHNTNSISLDDGTYLFVDTNGWDMSGNVADAHGATGRVYPAQKTGSGNVYKYVSSYYVNYTVSGQRHLNYGYAGIVTAAADMPTAGNATYSGIGDSAFFMYNLNNVASASEVGLDYGTSDVNVDFGAGTASVDMHTFTSIKDGNGVVLNAATTPLDEVKGTGLTVSGAHITGGTWVTMKSGSVVNLLGASPVATSNGTFFGYDPAISAPAEVAGVVLIKGSTMMGAGYFVGK